MKTALKVIGVAILGIFLIVGIPIFINELYNKGGYVTHWGAADVLGYYGSVLGGVITFLVFWIAIIRENRIRREEHTKQENERKRQAAIQRLNFVSSNLRFMLSKIDYSHVIINTLAANVKKWCEEPQEIYRFFGETSSVIFTNTIFTVEENEIIEKEYEELQEYAKAHANLLWELYILLVKYKATKSVSDANKQMLDHISTINASRESLADKIQNDGTLEKVQLLNDILDEMRKYNSEASTIINDENIKRKKISELLDSIFNMSKKFEDLFDEKYGGLLPTVKCAEEKLKAKIEVAE